MYMLQPLYFRIWVYDETYIVEVKNTLDRIWQTIEEVNQITSHENFS